MAFAEPVTPSNEDQWFADAGIWFGTRLLAPHERIVEIAVPAARTPNFTADIARERLGGAAAPRFHRSRERGLLP